MIIGAQELVLMGVVSDIGKWYWSMGTGIGTWVLNWHREAVSVELCMIV